LGFYPVTPGSDEYVFGSPLFNKVTLSFENGKKLVIYAPENSRENVYVQSIKLNGKAIGNNYIKHNVLLKGGKLVFRMGSQPELKRGTNEVAFPYSMSKQ
jgi:putative alpha-1,2-mannosidase